MSLKGKTALVTGAGRGIGGAIAQALGTEGAQLVLVARSKEQLEQTAADVMKQGGAPEPYIYTADLTNGQAVDELAEALIKQYKVVDILVNNAGMGTKGQTPLEGDPDAWQKMIDLNLSAPMRLTRRLAPAMVENKGGTIITIGSVAAVEPMKSACAYAATKYGVRGWSLSCHEALRSHNIKCVLINPGMVATDMVTDFVTGPNAHKERMIRPQDIAEAAMLAVRTSASACPVEITIRPVLPVFD